MTTCPSRAQRATRGKVTGITAGRRSPQPSGRASALTQGRGHRMHDGNYSPIGAIDRLRMGSVGDVTTTLHQMFHRAAGLLDELADVLHDLVGLTPRWSWLSMLRNSSRSCGHGPAARWLRPPEVRRALPWQKVLSSFGSGMCSARVELAQRVMGHVLSSFLGPLFQHCQNGRGRKNGLGGMVIGETLSRALSRRTAAGDLAGGGRRRSGEVGRMTGGTGRSCRRTWSGDNRHVEW